MSAAGARSRRGVRRREASHDDTPRTPGGSSTEAAAVNLLSPWVLEELRVRRLQLRFLAGGLTLVVAMALATAGLRLSLSDAARDLRDDRAITTALQAQVGEMAPVRTFAASVSLRARDVATTLAPEVAFSEAVDELDAALPEQTQLDTLLLTLVVPGDPSAPEPPAATSGCPGPDPFGTRTIVGCVQLTGTASSRADVGRLVQRLATSTRFVEPFITTTTTSEDEVSFSGTVGLDPRLLRGEYVDPTVPAAAPTDAPGSDVAAGATP